MCQHFEVLLKKQRIRSPMGLLRNSSKCLLNKYLKSKCGSGHMLNSGAYSAFIFEAHFYYDNLWLFPSMLCLIAFDSCKTAVKWTSSLKNYL